MAKHNARLKNQRSDVLPVLESPTFNQTIIINSPRFNINLIGDAKRKEHPSRQQLQQGRTLADFNPVKKTLSGLDSWMLNENLKQFGQTRQLLYQHGSEQDLGNPYAPQRVKKAFSTLQNDNVAKRRELTTLAGNSPYESNKTTLLARTAQNKHSLKARTVDVRRRKYLREAVAEEPLTPQYPAGRRFRANKFVMNNTLPVVEQEEVKQADPLSSQEISKDAGQSISDIDHSIQKVTEKYFEQGPAASRPHHDIERYLSAARQPALIPTRETEFISEIRTGDDALNFDFCFDEETEHQRQPRVPVRNFKIQRGTKSKPKQEQ